MKDHAVDKRSPIIIGALLLTAFFLSVFGWLLSRTETCPGGWWLWHRLDCLEPNALGDTFAGAFAPVAFVWLVAAVLLQRNELAAQRQELRDSREVAKAQVDLIEIQTKILDDERTRAIERESDEDLLELCRLAYLSFQNINRDFYINDGPLIARQFEGPSYSFRLHSQGPIDAPIDLVDGYVSSLVQAKSLVLRIVQDGGKLCYGGLDILEDLTEELTELIRISEQTSPPMRAAFRRTYLKDAPKHIQELASYLRLHGEDTKHDILPAPEGNYRIILTDDES